MFSASERKHICPPITLYGTYRVQLVEKAYIQTVEKAPDARKPRHELGFVPVVARLTKQMGLYIQSEHGMAYTVLLFFTLITLRGNRETVTVYSEEKIRVNYPKNFKEDIFMKTLVKSIAAMAATSTIAAFALVTAVSASSEAFNTSMQSETVTEKSHIRNEEDTTKLIGGTNHTEGYCNPSSQTGVDINCYNANGVAVTTNSIEYGLTASIRSTLIYAGYYKWCGITLFNRMGKSKTVISSETSDPNKQFVQVYNDGPGGIINLAYYTFCIYDNPSSLTDGNILGKTTLDLILEE